jgi:FkbM family methyltransferase
MSFENTLLPEVLRSVDHLYGSGNWDEGRYGKNRKNLIADGLAKVNAALNPTHLALGIRSNELERVEQLLHEHGKGLEELYRQLEDIGSRELLVKVLCFRPLGHHRVKLPLNTVAYWRLREKALSLICPTPPLHSFGWELPMIDLTSVGYPLQIYATPIAVTEQFLVRHYAYEKNGVAVRAEEGEFVIDAGGCWGDTALFFAHAVGPRGKVYTFEFVPENLAVMEKNFALNPELSSRVVISRQPLWHTPDLALSFSSQGPGSKLRNSVDPAGTTLTSTIDACMAQGMAPRVDFVKMDIEGAELPALQGAVETIRKFKPKLAISVYQSLEDFARIPSFLSGIGVPYRFFLSHATIHEEETVLFAAPS